VPHSARLWCRLTEASHYELADSDQLCSCFLTKVFHYWVGRNAWYGTWSSTYCGDYSFSLQREELLDQIEGERVQGSTFTLAELPALALLGKHLALILFQHHAQSPFQEVPTSAVAGASLLGVAESIRKRADRALLFVASPELPKATEPPYRRFGSVPQGSDYMLGWTPTSSYDTEAVSRLCKKVCALSRKPARLTSRST